MSENTQESKITIPDEKTLSQAFKLSIKISKPMCTYFYIDSCKNNEENK